MTTVFEHALAFLCGLGLPALGALQHRRAGAVGAAAPGGTGEPAALATRDKIAVYWSNSVFQWLVVGLVLAAWLGAGRTLAELGLTAVPSRVGLGLLLAALFAALYAADTLRQIAPTRIEATRARWRRNTPFMPASAREAAHALVMVATAATCEEIVFRGFLVHYLLRFTGPGPAGLALAVALPSCVFAAAHLYQGAIAGVKVALLSALFGAILLATGSLWIPIALHFAVDLVGVLLGLRLLGPARAPGAG